MNPQDPLGGESHHPHPGDGEGRPSTGWWEWDLATNRVTFSPAWRRLVGLQDGDIGPGAGPLLARVPIEERPELENAIADLRAGRVTGFEHKHRVVDDSGTAVAAVTRILLLVDHAGRPGRLIGTLSIGGEGADTVVAGAVDRLRLLERLAAALEESRAGSAWLGALLLFSLDRFKQLTSSLGRQIGQSLVAAVSDRVRTVLNDEPAVAIFAYLGGDEFGLLLERLRENGEATRIARRLAAELQEPFDLGGTEVSSSASVGIVEVNASYERADEILRDAGTAMDNARGGSGWALFDREMHQRVLGRLRLETELRRAVQREEFRVHYQPIVSLPSGRLIGFEALVRWQHPSGELLWPKEFVRATEETGLVVAMNRLVLRQVCHQLRGWLKQFRRNAALTVSLNISGVEFTRPDTIVEIDRIMRTYGIYGHNLRMEITESVLMEQARYAADMLRHLRALDIKVSIDDFGTGYSSLAYLQRFAIDTLKIDQSFVDRMDVDEESWEIVRTVASLGHNLHKDVVAEGIERPKQREMLLALNCKYGQGALFSMPVTAEVATEMLVANARGETLLPAAMKTPPPLD